MLAKEIGVAEDEYKKEITDILVTIGKGIYWHVHYHNLANALRKKIKKDIDENRYFNP